MKLIFCPTCVDCQPTENTSIASIVALNFYFPTSLRLGKVALLRAEIGDSGQKWISARVLLIAKTAIPRKGFIPDGRAHVRVSMWVDSSSCVMISTTDQAHEWRDSPY